MNKKNIVEVKEQANQTSIQSEKAKESSVTNAHILVLVLRSLSKPSQQIIKLKPGEYTVGRDPTCDIVILDPYVSRRHVKIFYRGGAWFVEDLGSKNGTFLNGENVQGKGPAELKTGAEIVIGFSVLTVKGLE